MITDFKSFGLIHLLSLFAAVVLGSVFILWGVRSGTEAKRRRVRLFLAAAIILVRGARYIMDVYFGVFEWYDLLSLHVCHIDMILLVICLIKPNKTLFNFCFLIGIPTALSVALFPGSNHPAPGLPRAVLFIMSHTMLVMGALYLTFAERMQPTLRLYGRIGIIACVCLVPLYFINRLLGTNFLYINSAPKGTAIAAFDKLFGWPGYVIALVVLALLLMAAMLGLGRLLFSLTEKTSKKRQGILPL